MLEVDRCDEEDERLVVEMRALQEWFTEEWDILVITKEKIEDESIQHQLDSGCQYLCRLCVLWQDALADYAGNWEGAWGPMEEQLLDARTREASAVLDVIDKDGDNLEFESEVDPVLMEQEETIALADVYRTTEEYLEYE
ncbi:hypothetical protein VKT23_000079 [Stygiomarasmius scandens]|uniref:Uncharacterized protein n=1 Tax=Marasmiellus scandens TaxID=2682957 RepID=A0ABR1K328_9AGAR